MAEIGELITPRKVDMTPQQYDELTSLFQGLEKASKSVRPYEQTLSWGDSLEEGLKGTFLGQEIKNFYFLSELLEIIVYRDTNPNFDELRKNNVITQQKISKNIFEALQSPRELKLLESQIKYLESGFNLDRSIQKHKLLDINGIRGMVFTSVCFYEKGFKVYLPEVDWDVHFGVDLGVEAPDGKRTAVSVKCSSGQQWLDIEEQSIKNQNEAINQEFQRYIVVHIPGSETSRLAWKNPTLGIPDKQMIEFFAKSFNKDADRKI